MTSHFLTYPPTRPSARVFDQCECHQSEPYWFFASKVYVKDAPAGIGQQTSLSFTFTKKTPRHAIVVNAGRLGRNDHMRRMG